MTEDKMVVASPTQWTWVWASSRSWWWTGKPGMLQSVGSQRVGHDWAPELNWTEPSHPFCCYVALGCDGPSVHCHSRSLASSSFFVAVPALHCGHGLFVTAYGLSLVLAPRLSVVTLGLSCPAACGLLVPRPKNQTRVPCIARWILNPLDHQGSPQVSYFLQWPRVLSACHHQLSFPQKHIYYYSHFPDKEMRLHEVRLAQGSTAPSKYQTQEWNPKSLQALLPPVLAHHQLCSLPNIRHPWEGRSKLGDTRGSYLTNLECGSFYKITRLH